MFTLTLYPLTTLEQELINEIKILSLFLILIFFSNKSFSLENRIIVKINKNILHLLIYLMSQNTCITNSNFENLDQNKIYKYQKILLSEKKLKKMNY